MASLKALKLRIGSVKSTQKITKAMKKVAGRLRLDLAQFRELEAFAQFGSELDPATQQALGRGERMVATLNQPQFQPMPVEEQVASIYSGTQGFLDTIDVKDVTRYEQAMLSYLRSEKPKVLAKIRETKQLDDDTSAALKDALAGFGKTFA